jgi:ketosteroid isomerase-like protein
MSQENVEFVRRGVEALNARDLDRHYVEFFDPAVEWRTSAEDPDAATHRGLQAYKRYLEQWLDSFDGLQADVEECLDVGDGRVFTWIRYTGRGRESGVPADWYLAIIFTIRDSKIVRGEEYFDRAQALDAVGLE